VTICCIIWCAVRPAGRAFRTRLRRRRPLRSIVAAQARCGVDQRLRIKTWRGRSTRWVRRSRSESAVVAAPPWRPLNVRIGVILIAVVVRPHPWTGWINVRTGRVRARGASGVVTVGRPQGTVQIAVPRRHRIWRPAASNHDQGIAGTFLRDHCKQQGGLLGVKSNAAMRGRSPQTRDIIAAMNRVPMVKEDSVGHGGVVINF